jgi:hypothetical protein
VARPRIFVSSTYYDLKHVRASLDEFIESLGFDSILSEKGDIAYAWTGPLDESCYREVLTSDIFLLILGGRYGSAASDEENLPEGFFDKYDSITRKEFNAAIEQTIPVYILVDRNVHAEFQTYQRNRESTDINYAYVDSINVFRLLDDIFLRPRNNPVQTFDRVSEITDWLKEQWAGLFRELLKSRSQKEQLKDLNQNVDELRAVNDTLKNYLEVVLRNVEGEDSRSVIEAEDKRLDQAKTAISIRRNRLVEFLENHDMELEDVMDRLARTSSFSEFLSQLSGASSAQVRDWALWRSGKEGEGGVYADFCDAREKLGLSKVPTGDVESVTSEAEWPNEVRKSRTASKPKKRAPAKKVSRSPKIAPPAQKAQRSAKD